VEVDAVQHLLGVGAEDDDQLVELRPRHGRQHALEHRPAADVVQLLHRAGEPGSGSRGEHDAGDARMLGGRHRRIIHQVVASGP
jgi:hypothetical protein